MENIEHTSQSFMEQVVQEIRESPVAFEIISFSKILGECFYTVQYSAEDRETIVGFENMQDLIKKHRGSYRFAEKCFLFEDFN